MPMTNYLQGKWATHVLGSNTFAKPSALYAALFTSAITPGGSGTEVTGGSYARVAITQADANWNQVVSSNTVWANANAITFPSPTANWGSVQCIALFDASSGGNMLAYATLSSTLNVTSGSPAPTFPASSLAATFT